MNNCRFCKNHLEQVFMDLGSQPPSNSFIKKDNLQAPELYFPLKLFVCEKCFLVQVGEHKSAKEIFDDNYIYFSSFSKSWLEHCRKYTELVTDRFKLDDTSKIVEIASNDGYLLQYFKNKNFQVLGIEPTLSTAEVAVKKGIPTWQRFWTKECGQDLRKELAGGAHLMIANNVLAHVPDINDFVAGIKEGLSNDGIFTAEFPHLLQLIKHNQFDTIYHEHFSYISLYTAQQIFNSHNLQIFDVEEIPTHGGSLRLYVDHGKEPVSARLVKLLAEEKSFGINQLKFYEKFQETSEKIKNQFLKFLVDAKLDGKKVAAYGAAAKGNTLLNFCGVKPDLLSFVVDASPYKQNHYLPGSHIPVVQESELRKFKPDYIIILPWNLKTEITSQLEYVREWDAKLVVAIPQLEIY